ncbi:MAG TPA: MG2 domain-containing protein [Pyrinomonadaceae bacterium]|nr:MG2 domain-containing protein [Pyrinomonadaceae bacterium]
MRRTILILSFYLLLALLFALQFSAAPLLLRVNEKGARLDFDKSVAVASLPIENVSGRSLSALVKLELVDINDKVRTRGERLESLSAGEQSVRVPLIFDFGKLDREEKKNFLFYRLRYSISAGETGEARVRVAEGVISLSEITPELFELRVSAPRRAREGAPYRARVLAAHPITHNPVRGVQLQAEIELDGGKDKLVVRAGGVTNAEGQAALDFNLPAKVMDEQADVTVTGRLKVFEQEAEATVEFDRTARLLLTSDKPLYQPGQTLHLRALVFDQNERAMPAATATFTIEDPDNTNVFRATSTTSRFGVATADWQIPESTPLGDYDINVELDDERFEDARNMLRVKISRYDLPNFTVNTKADRAYYLPGQNAEVEVRADYLFGEPVRRGRVRLVRERERRWDFKEQKWEMDEGETIEGELDASGRFTARINLEDEHESLAEESYSRFHDLTYAAYLTDATTNRTEQRRFDLRLTKEPIHIYVSEGTYNQAQGLPLAFFVSASYADGSPAECEVSVEVGEDEDYRARYYGSYYRPSEVVRKPLSLAVVRTNRYGLAKVKGALPLTGGDSRRYLSVKLSARDRKGLKGQHEEGMWLDTDAEVRVETDRAVYRPGEPVRAFITSNRENAVVFVDVTSEGKVIRSEGVRLEAGRGSITFPYAKDFDGKLSVVASFYEKPENRYSDGEVSGRRVILYPRDRELKLDVKLGQATYRPGEEAEAALSARASDGRSLESVFGVVIFDKAVEERARTDREFSSAYGFFDYFNYFRYGGGEVGGITLRDLERLDVKRRAVPEDLNLAADILLQSVGDDYRSLSFESNAFENNQAEVFGAHIRERLKRIKEALDARYDKTAEYPSNDEALRRFMREAGIEFDRLGDPWDMAYRARFFPERDNDVTEITSAGADKRFGTRDDFSVMRLARPYYRGYGERLDTIVNDYHARTGKFIRDEETLLAELARAGFDASALRDRWGEPYRFEFGTMGVLLTVRVRSGGPDRRFDARDVYGSDDFTLWTTLVDSFTDERAAIDKALNAYLQATGKFPQDEASLKEALQRAGIERDALRDPFGRLYLAGYKSESRYVDRVIIEARYNASGQPEKRARNVPVNQLVYTLTLFSAGLDNRTGTGDDFTAATFTSIGSVQSASYSEEKDSKPLTTFKGATGALTGTLTDPTGAVIAGANVTAVNNQSTAEYTATTDDSGVYIIRNLPPGIYTLRMSVPGFSVYVVEGVPVRSSALIKVDAMLNPAGITETVSVTADASAQVLNTTDTSISNKVERAGGRRPAQLSTPRLREYFPETLVWQPAIETDSAGRALLRFKLADNITTWKMSVIGSTESGEIGTAEREIRAFQPFFVEHDPPRILTEGDEIALPVVLRNYLDRRQVVGLEMKPESWFSLTGASVKRAEVRAGDAAREVFSFRATGSVKDGKQRVTAIGEDASDAIERVVTVHPDGQERAATDSRIFSDRATLQTLIPDDAVRGSLRGELKIYPNLIGHVIESIEAIMSRPHGCGEQTISSTYPSLLVLKAYKRNGSMPPDKLGTRAASYLRSGYERLLSYRDESGGFTYWGGRSEADLALTAYALRFLLDARELIEVDEGVITSARDWLIKEQLADGSWPTYAYNDAAKEARIAMTTALIARTLARAAKESPKTAAASSAQTGKNVQDALRLALQFLDRRVEATDEPYLIASYALAAIDAGDYERVERAVARLRLLAHNEGEGSYWSLETNSPFYGWGLAGRIETTALVLQALSRAAKSPDETDQLVSRGLLFLLKGKDRYGVWYSTQATINVLDALTVLLSNSSTAQAQIAASIASVIVNGKVAATIQLPPAGQLAGPLTYDISGLLLPGSNRVEIARGAGGGGPRLSAQVVSNYYLPWPRALSDETARGRERALKLAVGFDKTEVGVTNEVTCKVTATRLESKGYGMMLAEIGLPPGADVDRASLDRAMRESGWSFTRYDLLPDRLIVYLWPRASEISFDFKFRPRYGINALTAPSILYDYYNPEAQATLAPVRFVVR